MDYSPNSFVMIRYRCVCLFPCRVFRFPSLLLLFIYFSSMFLSIFRHRVVAIIILHLVNPVDLVVLQALLQSRARRIPNTIVRAPSRTRRVRRRIQPAFEVLICNEKRYFLIELLSIPYVAECHLTQPRLFNLRLFHKLSLSYHYQKKSDE